MASELGAAAAASFGGVAHTLFGDYTIAFLSAGLAGLAAAGFSLQLRGARRAPLPEPATA